jgi:quercetin dioxygenase-like cupin family protein
MTRKTRAQLSHQRDIIMSDTAQTSSQPGSPIPSDDPQRTLTVANPDAPAMRHISVAGDIYTILVGGAQSDGRYCLIDMHVPTGGGPPPHRHDFEEMFTLLEGELEFTFRGEKSTVRAGSTVNIPANAPHAFKNVSDTPARMLCMCTPAGQEEFFIAIGDAVDSRTAPPPKLGKDAIAERQKKAGALLAKYRTEMAEPWS